MPKTTNHQDQASAETAGRIASRAGRVLSHWRWGHVKKLLEAAGQLALFDHPDDSEPGDQDDAP